MLPQLMKLEQEESYAHSILFNGYCYFATKATNFLVIKQEENETILEEITEIYPESTYLNYN